MSLDLLHILSCFFIFFQPKQPPPSTHLVPHRTRAGLTPQVPDGCNLSGASGPGSEVFAEMESLGMKQPLGIFAYLFQILAHFFGHFLHFFSGPSVFMCLLGNETAAEPVGSSRSLPSGGILRLVFLSVV